MEKNNITSFSCYRFVFKLGPATGSAVGIVTTTAFIIKYIVPLILLKLSKGTKGSICRKCLTITIQVTLALVATLLTSLMVYLRYSISYSPLDLLNAIRYLPIGYIIASNIIFIPWCKFKKIESDEAETEGSDEYKRVSINYPHTKYQKLKNIE